MLTHKAHSLFVLVFDTCCHTRSANPYNNIGKF